MGYADLLLENSLTLFSNLPPYKLIKFCDFCDRYLNMKLFSIIWYLVLSIVCSIVREKIFDTDFAMFILCLIFIRITKVLSSSNKVNEMKSRNETHFRSLMNLYLFIHSS